MICPHCKTEFEPLVLSNAKQKKLSLTFDGWIKSLNGAEPIPYSHHAMIYAREIKLPQDIVWLHWQAFCRKYSGAGKKYLDWGKAFRNSLEGNWFHLYFIDSQQQFCLTTAGLQLKRSLQARGAA